MEVYDSSEIVVLINGVSITGLVGSNDAVSVERAESSMNHVIGLNGRMMASLNSDKSGKATIKLQQTSKDNKIFSDIVAMREAGVVEAISMMIKDNVSSDEVIGEDGYIIGPSNFSRGKEPGEQTWTMMFGKIDFLYKAEAGE